MDVAVEAAVPAAIDADLHLGMRRRSGPRESKHRRSGKLKEGNSLRAASLATPKRTMRPSPQIGPTSKGLVMAASHRHDGTHTHDL